jgi:hypothetical protein
MIDDDDQGCSLLLLYSGALFNCTSSPLPRCMEPRSSFCLCMLWYGGAQMRVEQEVITGLQGPCLRRILHCGWYFVVEAVQHASSLHSNCSFASSFRSIGSRHCTILSRLKCPRLPPLPEEAGNSKGATMKKGRLKRRQVSGTGVQGRNTTRTFFPFFSFFWFFSLR